MDWAAHLAARLETWRAAHLARELRVASGAGVRLSLDGRPVLSFASNDYLGLAAHPQVLAAAQAALLASGAGSSASPLICGHKTPHAALETQLAAFKRSAAALVFPSGYQAAVATISALVDPAATVLVDRLSHASLIDGARLSGARLRVFKHNDVKDLARVLARESARRCLVLVESLYSMDGDTAPLDALAALTARSGALLLVDEAHATGVLGATGRGALEALTQQHGGLPAHIIALGTLSKALGSQGGFICASREVVSTIVHAGRAYLFSTALAPASAAAASAALQLIDAEPERRTRVLALAQRLREELAARGAHTIPGLSPIVPVLLGDEALALERSRALLARGLLVPAIRYPTVKRGQARLRISLSAAHSDADLDLLLASL